MEWSGVIVAVASSTAIFSFIQFLIKRHDDSKSDLKGINQSIKEINLKINELEERDKKNAALAARMRIIRFSDELITGGVHHSLGHFQSIMEDIDVYETYFANKDIENGYGKSSCKIIRGTFEYLINKGEFRNDEWEGKEHYR